MATCGMHQAGQIHDGSQHYHMLPGAMALPNACNCMQAGCTHWHPPCCGRRNVSGVPEHALCGLQDSGKDKVRSDGVVMRVGGFPPRHGPESCTVRTDLRTPLVITKQATRGSRLRLIRGSSGCGRAAAARGAPALLLGRRGLTVCNALGARSRGRCGCFGPLGIGLGSERWCRWGGIEGRGSAQHGLGDGRWQATCISQPGKAIAWPLQPPFLPTLRAGRL